MAAISDSDSGTAPIIKHFDSPAFTQRVESLLDEWHVPGISIAITQGKEVSSKGFGFATLDPKVACTADTIFDIASSSKSLTAASVGLLVQDDEKFSDVQWDAKMSDLLPEDFVMSEDSYTKDVTVEDILSHRTGLAGSVNAHDDAFFGIRSQTPDTVKSVTRNLRNLPISAPIRTKYQYSNTMMTVATHLVETLTNTSFGEFVQDSFWVPLNLHDTYLLPSAVEAAGKQDRLAMPYLWQEKSKSFALGKLQESPEAQGAGSIQTSVNDYIKWVRALMYQEGPISKDLYEGLTRVRIFQDSDVQSEDRHPLKSFTGYAAGLEVFYYRGYQVVGHDGLISGYGSRHFWVPEIDFGAVLLGNAEGAQYAIEVLAYELIDELLDIPHTQRTDWNARARESEERFKSEMSESVAKKLRPDLEVPEPQKVPLSSYVGEYWNAGYKCLKVEVKENKLHVDATDRSMGFWLDFEHLADQTLFVVKLTDYWDGVEESEAAEFRFENDRVISMGLKLESDFENYIWFDRVGLQEMSDSINLISVVTNSTTGVTVGLC